MKVFGIGMPKTGTTSLTSALDTLGFRPALHNPICHRAIAECGSATDLTIAWRFDRLAKIWPHARFVMTTREMGPWLISAERHWRDWESRRDYGDLAQPDSHYLWVLREAMIGLFGRWDFEVNIWAGTKIWHEDRVRRFFVSQPDRLLVIDITAPISNESKWRPLCRFLDVPVPDVSFPHLNRAVERA